LENQEKPLILVTQEQPSLKWSKGSRQTTGTAKGNGLCVPFNQYATVLEHELQQILGAQTLPSFPI
jgi:hypothetical protein